MTHPLKRYLEAAQEPAAEFAARLGVSRQTIYRIMNEEQTPKPALARRIVQATGGAVSLDALFGDAQSAEIVSFGAEKPGQALDPYRLKTALTIAFNHIAPDAFSRAPEDLMEIAAEAAANTYLALSTVTTRQGSDRLKQALKPVMVEVFEDLPGGQPQAPDAIDRGADLAALLYSRSWRLEG